MNSINILYFSSLLVFGFRLKILSMYNHRHPNNNELLSINLTAVPKDVILFSGLRKGAPLSQKLKKK